MGFWWVNLELKTYLHWCTCSRRKMTTHHLTVWIQSCQVNEKKNVNKSTKYAKIWGEGLFFKLPQTSRGHSDIKHVYWNTFRKNWKFTKLFFEIGIETDEWSGQNWMLSRLDLTFFMHFHYPCQAKFAGVDTNRTTNMRTQYSCSNIHSRPKAFEWDHSNCKLFQTFNMWILRPICMNASKIALNWYVSIHQYDQKHFHWKYG